MQNVCGTYRVFAAEVLPNARVCVDLEDVKDKNHTLRLMIGPGWLPVPLGVEIEIVRHGGLLRRPEDVGA